MPTEGTLALLEMLAQSNAHDWYSIPYGCWGCTWRSCAGLEHVIEIRDGCIPWACTGGFGTSVLWATCPQCRRTRLRALQSLRRLKAMLLVSAAGWGHGLSVLPAEYKPLHRNKFQICEARKRKKDESSAYVSVFFCARSLMFVCAPEILRFMLKNPRGENTGE